MKRKILSFVLAMMTALTLTACGGTTEKKTEEKIATQTEQKTAEVTKPEKDIEMKYITPDDAKTKIGAKDTLFIDVRKAEDYAKGHIKGSVSADMDASNKGGDFQAGVNNIKPVIDGVDKNIVLVCYSGKSYAQAATNTLSALGYDMTKVSTLEGGMKAWTAKFPDDELEK